MAGRRIERRRGEVRTGVISDLERGARLAFAVAQETKVVALVAGEWDGVNDGGGQSAQQQQDEGDKEDDGQRRGGAEHDGGEGFGRIRNERIVDSVAMSRSLSSQLAMAVDCGAQCRSSCSNDDDDDDDEVVAGRWEVGGRYCLECSRAMVKVVGGGMSRLHLVVQFDANAWRNILILSSSLKMRTRLSPSSAKFRSIQLRNAMPPLSAMSNQHSRKVKSTVTGRENLERTYVGKTRKRCRRKRCSDMMRIVAESSSQYRCGKGDEIANDRFLLRRTGGPRNCKDRA
nr:hypothetical protein CFP56_74983 [Quercus suber]